MTGFALSHIGIAVPNLDVATARLAALLGQRPTPVRDNPEQGVRLVQFDLGNARIELLSPTGEDGPVAAFLRRNPRGGLHHLALAHPDLDSALAALAGEGAHVLVGPGINVFGRRFAFLPPTAIIGVLTEIEEELSLPALSPGP